MRRILGPLLAASMLLASNMPAGLSESAAEEQAETRLFLQRFIKNKIEQEELLICVAIINDIEGNHATILKLNDIQKYYQTHKPRNRYRLGWVAAKLAHYHALKGENDQASKECTKAMQYFTRMPDPLYSDAVHFYLEGMEDLYPTLFKVKRAQDGARMRQAFNQGKKYLGDHDARIFMYAAWGSLLLDDFEQAKGFCEESLKVDPTYCAPYWVRALVQLEEGHVEKSKLELNKALQLCPTFGSAYEVYGLCELDQKHYDEAIAHLNKAISMKGSEDDAGAYAIRGIIKYCKRDTEGTVEDLGTAIKRINEGDYKKNKIWMLHAMRGECLLNQRKYEESDKEISQAIALSGKITSKQKAILHWERSAALEGLNQGDKALADLNKAIELDPSNKDIYKSRGELRLTLGDAMGSSDYDHYSKMIVAEENETFVGKKGQSIVSKIGGKKRRVVAEDKSGKPSWISDTGSSSSSSSDNKATKTETPAPPKPAETAAPVEATASKDPYISYFENKLVQVGSLKPGAATEKGSIRIEPDGVPVLLEKSENTRMLQDLIMRAAPFKQPPSDKPAILRVEYDPSGGLVKADYQN